MAASERQHHVDQISAALSLIPLDGNLEALKQAYLSLGWLAAAAIEAPQHAADARRAIDVAEDDAIRISSREPLIGG